jgi:hypothetical protein
MDSHKQKDADHSSRMHTPYLQNQIQHLFFYIEMGSMYLFFASTPLGFLPKKEKYVRFHSVLNENNYLSIVSLAIYLK